jgi:signal transduction histidine kinase
VHVALTGGADGESLSVSVSDRGLGIPAEHLPYLFDRFYRVDARNRSIRGVGLGLYICRSLVEAHGGEVWVESAPGVGSIFGFTLPASRQPIEDWPAELEHGAARGVQSGVGV